MGSCVPFSALREAIKVSRVGTERYSFPKDNRIFSRLQEVRSLFSLSYCDQRLSNMINHLPTLPPTLELCYRQTQ